MVGENTKLLKMELPTVNKLLTEASYDKLEVATWFGQGIEANREICHQLEAIDSCSLTPDETIMTLNPGSVSATREFRAYKESKTRGVNKFMAINLSAGK